MIVPGQQNIKIHYAGVEHISHANMVMALGNKYLLYTAYPFMERVLFTKAKAPLFLHQLKDKKNEVPQFLRSRAKHVIQDSGLFTLMFGAQEGKKDRAFLDRYYAALIEFTNSYAQGVTCVEMDVQKVLGVEEAWEYRERMRRDIPNRMINVFHIEDGPKGLDRLVEYSDYIAISVPELRRAGKKMGTIPLANYIKNKKPAIDIHLLGCTEGKLLRELRFCSSSDSTSYLSAPQYGFIKGRRTAHLNVDRVLSMISKEDYDLCRTATSDKYMASVLASIKSCMMDYERSGGPQD